VGLRAHGLRHALEADRAQPVAPQPSRAAFLRALVRDGALAGEALAQDAGVDLPKAVRLLEDLEREGFVARDADERWVVGD
jgi:DNA-binding MarR family transcriptional regulator